MNRVTIQKRIQKKIEDWISTIEKESLRQSVKENLLVSGGSITSMFLNEKVNDYDIYIKNMDVLINLAEYYCPGMILDGRKRSFYMTENNFSDDDDNFSEMAVRIKNLKSDQVRLNISSVGEKKEVEDNVKYQPIFLSPNAISLTDDVQIVLRFHGDSKKIHSTFDFIHATNYFTFEEGLVTNVEALESILSKNLRYQGSLYPLTSIIRIKKFLKRGWFINAGEMLKIMFQISQLNLTNVQVLEEQLIGVDIAYFSKLIEILRGVESDKLTPHYLNTIIDRVFNQYDGEDSEEQ